MGKRKKREKEDAKTESQAETQQPAKGKILYGRRKRNVTSIAIYGLGVLGVVGLALFGVFYSSHKTAAIWLAFFPSVVIFAAAFCLYWQEQIWKEEAARVTTSQQETQRKLSAEQRRIIIGALQPYTNQGISVTRLGDAEARAYATQIIDALAAAEWKLSITDIGMMVPPKYGILCIIENPEQPSPAAGALLSAFESAGIPVSVERGGDIHNVSLFIGLKPLDLSK